MTVQLRQDVTQIYLLLRENPTCGLKLFVMVWVVIWLTLRFRKEKSVWKRIKFEYLGKTLACVAIAWKFCSYIEKVEVTLQYDVKNKELWIGDSWFGSVQTVAHLAKNGKYSIIQILFYCATVYATIKQYHFLRDKST